MPPARKEDVKPATVQTGTKEVVISGKAHRVPVTATVAKESDLFGKDGKTANPELVITGPITPRMGEKTDRAYITVDAQRLRFSSEGTLLSVS